MAVDVARQYVPEREWYLPLSGVIVDAGAYLGYRAMRFARRGRVIAVEALADNFVIMRRNIDANHVDVHADHLGLWNEAGELPVYGSGKRSSLTHSDRATAPTGMVRTQTLDGVLDEADVDTADYANIDLSGAELAVLQGMTPRRITSLRIVCSATTFDACRRWLEDHRARVHEASTTTTLYASFKPPKRKPLAVPALEKYEKEREHALEDPDRYAAFVRRPSDPDVLHDYLARFVDDALARAKTEPDGAARIFAWGWGYAAEAALTAYLATHRVEFVDLVASSFTQILRHRDSVTGRSDDILGRSLRSWGGLQRMGKRKHLWISNATIAGRISLPVAQLCRLVATHPPLERYETDARGFQQAIETALGEFSDHFVVDEARDEAWIDRHFDKKLEPINHAAAIGSSLLVLSALTAKKEYTDRARQLANYLKASLVRNERGAYEWRFAPLPDDRWRPDRERIWKGAVTIWLPLLAHEHGVVFTRDDMDAFAGTFLRTIWRGGTSFHQYVDGNDYVPFDSPIRQEQNRAINLVGWIHLDRFRPEVRKVIETAVAERPDVFTGWLQHPIGARAYAYRLFEDPEDYWAAWR